jgi:hypothetical protein
MLNGAQATKRRPYLAQEEAEEAIEYRPKRRASRWPGRLFFLLALCVAFAVLGRAFVLDYSFSLILGLVLGFLLRNTE